MTELLRYLVIVAVLIIIAAVVIKANKPNFKYEANKLKSKKSEERSSVPILLAIKNNAMMGFLTIYSLIESLY